ncbi:Synaptotagmin-4 [Folsomia candida]|uniref:Synaptotagmin-4 n=1 Tax=Folsomia candida TaxID=158441 RepID=A0A226EUH9_FOLCA|nr:Synaptotagmin-4 [Folsomia candida]
MANKILLHLLVLAAFLALVHSAGISKGKLRFKVSGRNLPDKDTGLGTTDGYFQLYVSTDGGRTKTKLTKSDTINDQENPNWGNVFEFEFDRSKNQYWFFEVLDDDTLAEDDTVGRVWVNVANYVDKGQITTAKLDKEKGYLIIQSVDKPVQIDASTPVGQLPMPAGTKDVDTISGLPTKDDVGFVPGKSDPYVIITATDGISGKEREVGRSSTVSSSSSPNWGDVFQFQWDRKKDQRFKLKIWDEDTLGDEKLGLGWMEVNDFVAQGSYTLLLPKKGTITLTKA